MTYTPEVVEAGVTSRGASYLDWGAIIGGALVAAAVAFIFISFGSAVGLGIISPVGNDGASPTTVGILAAVWFLITSALAYYFGGYIAGRMRGVWSDSTASEVETRDAMHGVVVWAAGALLFIWIGASTVATVTTGVAEVGAEGAAALNTAVQSEEAGNLADYTIDKLYRTDLFATDADPQYLREQASRVFLKAIANGEFSDDDKAYLVSIVAAQTSLTQSEAEERVDTLFAEAQAAANEAAAVAKEAADAIQNATVVLGFLVAAGFLISLISAWFGAVMGGSHRDNNTLSSIFVIARRTR